MFAMLPQLTIPVREVLVRNLSGYIENQNAAVRTVVVARVHFVEHFLASRVPKIFNYALERHINMHINS